MQPAAADNDGPGSQQGEQAQEVGLSRLVVVVAVLALTLLCGLVRMDMTPLPTTLHPAETDLRNKRARRFQLDQERAELQQSLQPRAVAQVYSSSNTPANASTAPEPEYNPVRVLVRPGAIEGG